MTVFGPLVTPTMVEQAVLDTLKTHLERYLGEAGRVTGRGQNAMPMPKHWAVPQGTYDTWPQETPPVVALESPGTDGDPWEDDGSVSTNRLFGVVVVGSGNSEQAADSFVKDYGYAVAWCLSQQPVGLPVESIRFLGDSFDDLPLKASERRSMAMARLRFRAVVPDVFNRYMGPVGEPPEDPRDPHPDVPTALTVDVDVQHLDD